jgi:GST-like protein
VMAQSAAILMALDERHPQARLLPPPGSEDRRAALQWLVFVVAEIYPLVEIEDYPRRFVADGADVDGLKAQAVARMRERWLMVEAVAHDATHFLPSGFSALDLMIGMVSSWIIGADWRRTQCPKLDGIHASVIRRPAVAPVWARHAV